MTTLGQMKVGMLTGWSLDKIIEVRDRLREEFARHIVETHLAIDVGGVGLSDHQFKRACLEASTQSFEWFWPPYLEALKVADPDRGVELAAYGMVLPEDFERLYERVVELLTVSTHPLSGRVLAVVVDTVRNRHLS